MNDVLLNLPYVSQLHLPMKAATLLPSVFRMVRLQYELLPCQGSSDEEVDSLRKKSKDNCQAILRSTYCEP